MTLTNDQVVQVKDRIEWLRMKYNLTNDHIECAIIITKIDLLEFLLELSKINTP